MNTTENCSEDHNLIIDLVQASNAIILYAIVPVSSFGFILNILTVILLARSKFSRLNTSFYESIFCRIICDTIVCFFGILNVNFACKCNVVTESDSEWYKTSSYEYIFFITFISWPGIRISLLASAFSEIALVLNRQVPRHFWQK